jgi:hypothetical protein
MAEDFTPDISEIRKNFCNPTPPAAAEEKSRRKLKREII